MTRYRRCWGASGPCCAGAGSGRCLVRKCYVVAIDGLQKRTRDQPWAPEALRWRSGEDGARDTAHVLEAALLSPQVPLAAEFRANDGQGDEASKQDCEQKAFHRLAARLQKGLPAPAAVGGGRRPLPQRADPGPLPALRIWSCVRPDDSLKSVGAEAEGLHRLEPENTHPLGGPRAFCDDVRRVHGRWLQRHLHVTTLGVGADAALSHPTGHSCTVDRHRVGGALGAPATRTRRARDVGGGRARQVAQLPDRGRPHRRGRGPSCERQYIRPDTLWDGSGYRRRGRGRQNFSDAYEGFPAIPQQDAVPPCPACLPATCRCSRALTQAQQTMNSHLLP